MDSRSRRIQTNNLSSGYELVGSKQPLSGSIVNLGLNLYSSANPVNQILKWNVGAQRYVIYTRVTFGSGWIPSVPIINVGEGFLTRLAAPYSWVQNFTVQ